MSLDENPTSTMALRDRLRHLPRFFSILGFLIGFPADADMARLHDDESVL